MTEKVVAITGASSGIGAAAAELLAEQGHRVALIARRPDALDAVASRCRGRALAVTADVTRRDEVRRAVETIVATLGGLDVWINNAGRGISRAPSELTDDDIDSMIEVNVKSVLYGMQEVLPHFRIRGGGHIINISSMLARIPYAVPRSAYGAAKHFVNALTANFREELQGTDPGIQISLVSPGVVYTDFGKNAVHGGPDSRELPYGQTPAEVAEVIARVVESRAPDVYTRVGSQARVAEYYASVGADPTPA